MKNSLKVILIVLTAALIFPPSLFAEKDAPNLTIPKNWVYSARASEFSGVNTFFTSSDPKEALMVLIRTISVPHQSALEWANDEADGIKSKGAKILVSPVEIVVNKKSWIKLESLLYNKSADGRTGTSKSEQYFAKQGSDLLVEVSVFGGEINFNASNRQGIEELLSSFNSDAKGEGVKEVATARFKESEKLQFHKDVSGDLSILSPKYIQNINYTSEKPPFTIPAPEGWYMAINHASIDGMNKVVFSQYDPSDAIKTGHFEIPFFNISLLPNPKKQPALSFAQEASAKLRSKGVIVLEPEEIKTKDTVGYYYYNQTPNGALIKSLYVFACEDTYIIIRAFCGTDEFKEVQPKIREAVKLIRFASSPEDILAKSFQTLNENMLKKAEKLGQEGTSDGTKLSEEKRKLFYNEYIDIKDKILKEAMVKYPEDLPFPGKGEERTDYERKLEDERVKPLLETYHLTLDDIGVILFEGRQKSWRKNKK